MGTPAVRLIVIVTLLGFLVLGACACGQKGDLYLPDEAPQDQDPDTKKKT